MAPYEKLQQIPECKCSAVGHMPGENSDKALESYKPEAEKTLSLIQELYNVEKHCRDQNLNYEQRRKIRQDQSKVILQKIKSYLEIHSKYPSSILPWVKLDIYIKKDGGSWAIISTMEK